MHRFRLFWAQCTVHHQLYLGNFYRTFSIIRKCCKVFIIQKITKIQKIPKHSSFLNLLHIQTFVLCHYYTGSVFSIVYLISDDGPPPPLREERVGVVSSSHTK